MAHGVGPGDAIITSPFTFIATAEVICLLGAIPVFVDIDPATFILDPKHVEKAIQALRNGSGGYPLPRSNGPLAAKGVMPVDLFGLPADYESINAISRQHKLSVIERCRPVVRGSVQRQEGLFIRGYRVYFVFSSKTSRLLWRWRHVFYERQEFGRGGAFPECPRSGQSQI